MAGNHLRRSPYVRENVRFFIEEMIAYTLNRRDVNLEIERPEHLQRLRAVAMLSFSPSIGDAVMITFNKNRNIVLRDSQEIWSSIHVLRRDGKRDVLYTCLVAYAMKVIKPSRNPKNLFILMAVVSNLCERFCHFGYVSLVEEAVTSLEFIFNNLVHRGFVRTMISLIHHALKLRLSSGAHV